jgi:mycothiol synthase
MTITVEGLARSFKHLVNCDPHKDMLFVEIKGNVIGYTQVQWQEESDGTRNYDHFAILLPEWRGKGIRRCMLLFNERRAREIAAEHPEGERFFRSWADDTETHWISLLLREGYSPARYYFVMMRSLLEPILDVPLPEGIEIRHVTPDDCWTIWRAADEALQDDWGGSDLTDEILNEWMDKPTFDPGLWVAAWDVTNDRVAGVVLASIDEEENQEYNRKRTHMGPIGVRRPYRRKGLASALIAKSLKVLRDFGMTEAVLSVDSENLTGALHLYERMGFSTIKQFTTYGKPMQSDKGNQL